MNKIVAVSKIETEKDFLEFIAPDRLPGARISNRGLSRLIGCDPKALLTSRGLKSKKLAGMLAAKGIDPGDQNREGWTASAAWIALKYFAYKSRNEYPQAEAIADTFGAIGIQTMLARSAEQSNQTNLAQWQEERQSGKVVRRSLTDMIALFIQYAEAQGCLSGKWYYTNFSSLVNKYIIEGYPKSAKGIKDKRDRMVESQLRHIKNMEDVLARIISDGMDAGDGYHDIYEACKSRVSAVAAVLYVDPLPLLPESNRKIINQQLAKALKAS
jgi:hypothetical protein